MWRRAAQRAARSLHVSTVPSCATGSACCSTSVEQQACASLPAGRSYSSPLAMESKEHISARLDYATRLKALRVKWKQEHQEEQDVKEQRLLHKMQRIQQAKKHREELRAKRKHNRAAAVAQDAQAHEAEEEARQQKAQQWRAAVAEVYAGVQQQRRAKLMEQSKDWIRPENLEERIQEALDNPVKLYR